MKEADEKIVDEVINSINNPDMDDDDDDGDAKDDLKVERQRKVEQQNAIFANGVEQEKRRVEEEQEEEEEKREEKAYPKLEEDASEEEMTKYTSMVLINQAEYNRRAIIGGFALAAGFENAAKEVKLFLERFSQAQVNKDANFLSGAKPEGPADYQNIIKKAQEFNALIEGKDPNVTLGQLGEKYVSLMKDVRQYRADHKPRFRGHTSPESAERYKIMGDLYENGIYMKKALNMLASSAKASMKAAGQQLPVNDMTLGELSPKFIDTFSRDADQKPITISGPEMEEISKTAFETAQMHKNNEAKKILIKGIKKQMSEKNSKNLDINGYYKATPENSEGYEIRRGGDFASTYQMIEAAVVKRDLDRCKDPNVTVDELKSIYKNLSSGGQKKEISALSRSRAVAFKFKTAAREGKDLQEVADAIVNANTSLKQKMAQNVDIMRNGTVYEWIQHNGVQPDREPSFMTSSFAYNYLLSDLLANNTEFVQYSTASRSHLISDDTKNKEEQFRDRMYRDFIKKTGVLDDMLDKPLNDEMMREMTRRLDDPKIKKTFNRLAMNVERQIFDRNLSEARDNLNKAANAQRNVNRNVQRNNVVSKPAQKVTPGPAGPRM